MVNSEKIIGSWKLLDFVIERADGSIKVWGKNPHGLLIYSPDGYMSVSINSELESENANDSKNIFDSMLFYAGSYQISEDMVTHYVTEATSLDRIGKEMVRQIAFRDNCNILDIIGKGSFGIARLSWRRIRRFPLSQLGSQSR